MTVLDRPIPQVVRERSQAAPPLLRADPVRSRRITANSSWAVAGMASVISIVAFVYCYQRGWTLAYNDSISHMLIARRVIDSTNPGLGQLGTVWLPLPHLLMLPFIGIDPLYYSGAAGSIISMAAFVVAAVYLYKLVRGLTGDGWAGWVAAAVFMLNANVLFMQTTPMTELLLLATMVVGAYHVMRWSQTGEYLHLTAAGFAILLATLSRYEGWVFALTMTAVVVLISIRQRRPWKRTQDLVIAFSIFWGAGIGLWVLWNQLIDKNPLSFQNGAYAKPSLWVGAHEAAKGHWGTAAKTYGYAIQGNVGWAMLAVCGAGLVYFIVRSRLGNHALSSIAFLVFIPFFVLALESGQRPLHVRQITGDLYNVRFGLLIIIPMAIGAGYLAGIGHAMRFGWVPKVAIIGVALISGLVMVHGGQVTTLNEAKAMLVSDTAKRSDLTSRWLEHHYDRGLILMEGTGNETIPFYARIALDNVVYEGSKQFKHALTDPTAEHIRWIVARDTSGQPDRVYKALHGRRALAAYRIVHRDADRVIYEARRGER
ncbi:MAG: glycosyltransferase family 39 protein [Actinomycetota bacterium]|nr:glycosyltransferase family 39 protein [Actinomycetota bacterium]